MRAWRFLNFALPRAIEERRRGCVGRGRWFTVLGGKRRLHFRGALSKPSRTVYLEDNLLHQQLG
jgi:hypothetical protein